MHLILKFLSLALTDHHLLWLSVFLLNCRSDGFYLSASGQKTQPQQMTMLMSHCVSCAKAEQTHGSMTGKAAERQHWFDVNISLSLFSALSFRTEMSPEERSEKCDASHSARPDQMASCLFTLFLLVFFFFLSPSPAFICRLTVTATGLVTWPADRSLDSHNQTHPRILRLPAHSARDQKIFRIQTSDNTPDWSHGHFRLMPISMGASCYVIAESLCDLISNIVSLGRGRKRPLLDILLCRKLFLSSLEITGTKTQTLRPDGNKHPWDGPKSPFPLVIWCSQ